MSNDPTHAIAEAIAEAQAILHDHLDGGVGSPADALARANLVLSERTLIRALHDTGFMPSNNPPDATSPLPIRHRTADQSR
jgi:hypothetical protein